LGSEGKLVHLGESSGQFQWREKPAGISSRDRELVPNILVRLNHTYLAHDEQSTTSVKWGGSTMLIPNGAIGSNASVFRLTIFAFLFLVWPVLCGGAPSQPVDSQTTAPQPSTEQWRADLHYLAEQMRKRHKNLFHDMTQEQFTNAVSQLDEEIPSLNRHQIIVGLARIVAMVGDGHTSLQPYFNPSLGFHLYPLHLYMFKDGLFVRSADSAYASVVGGRVLRIGQLTADEAFARVAEIVNRDNDMTVKDVASDWLTIPEILHGLGIISDVDNASFQIDQQGKLVEIHVKPMAWAAAIEEQHQHRWVDARDHAPNPIPLYLKNPHNSYWFEYLKDSRVVYVQYNAVQDKDKPEETVAEFFERVFQFVDANPVDKFVLDIRLNGGGNGYLNWPLIYDIIRSDKVNQKGKLFVVIGRQTFSAATMCAVYLERHTNTIFVGEPTGGSPNGYGDHAPIVLPNSGIRIFVSTLYWQESDPRDRRPWIPPQVAADLTSTDYKANVDPAMRAVFDYRAEPSLTEVVRAAVLAGNPDDAQRQIRNYKTEPANAYHNIEAELNRLGYSLMEEGKLAAAVEVFRLNVKAYPVSSNVYDSLGEAYAQQGEKQLAIENYRKALELNPRNDHARDEIARLGHPDK
jgi:Tetratricopeptide repeat/Peptidase family S41